MPRLRFETARDLFEAFPDAQERLMIEPTEEPSLAFLDNLAAQSVDKAVGFCAYLLARREAVWWGCQCVRALDPPTTPVDQRLLAAAEDWVREPEDDLRIAALVAGREGPSKQPATWMALAAGWAGNTMPFEDKPVPVPPDQTAKAVRAGILIAASKVDPRERTALLRKCIEEGARLAADETRSA